MLSGVFRFVLPELSSHFVLHDLLGSFRLERPLPSSQVPPWDLLAALHFLRGPPFEPLSSCSLRDLTQKVLFLVSLATACRFGELQAVSRDVSFSGVDIYLSYLPEFRAKTESSVIYFLALFACAPWRSLSAIFRRNFCCVLYVLCIFIFLLLLLFLRLLILFLFLLVLLLVLFLRTLLVSFFAVSSLVRLPLPLLLLLGILCLLLLLPLLPFGCIACGELRLRGVFRVMLLSLLSLRPLLGLFLLCSLLSTLRMSSSLLPVVLV